MQIPVINGIYTNEDSDFRTSYPRNLIPVPQKQGISQGYLRPGDGLVELGTGPGIDRGGINWEGVCYRVMGTKLVRLDSSGNATTIGEVGGSTQVSIDYSFPPSVFHFYMVWSVSYSDTGKRWGQTGLLCHSYKEIHRRTYILSGLFDLIS